MNKHPRFKYLYLLIDVLVLSTAYYFSLGRCLPGFWEISLENTYFYISHAALYGCFLLTFILTFRFNNLYRRNIVLLRYRQFLIILKALLIGSGILVLFMTLVNIQYLVDYGRIQLVYFLLLSLPLFLLARPILARSLFRLFVNRRILRIRLLIIGGDAAAGYAAAALEQDRFSDFSIVGFVDDYKEIGAKIYKDFKNLGRLEDLAALLNELDVDEILIAIDNAPYARMIAIVETCLKVQKLVRIYSNLFEIVSQKLDVEHYANIPLIHLPQHSTSGVAWQDKRILDVALASAALICLSPFFLLVALCIKVSSRGPVIYKQTRIGKNGRPFDFYKFRSMHQGSEETIHKTYVQNLIKNGGCSTGRDDIQVFKIKDDPRIFPFGKLIRKTSIDEFPQLVNVIKGDMSLIGPRPCLPYEWECYEEWHKNRLSVLPGCTGLWQALGRSTVTFEEMVLLDLYYISNMSLWLDLKIVLKTFPVIFLGRGGF